MAGQDTNKLVSVEQKNVCSSEKKMKACLQVIFELQVISNLQVIFDLQVMGAGGAGALLLLLIVLVAVTTR